MLYNCLIPKKEIEAIDLRHFPIESLYEVMMVDNETGDIRLMIFGMQNGPEHAMNECSAHMHRNDEIIDAWAIVERVV